jgi:hypothetical protein
MKLLPRWTHHESLDKQQDLDMHVDVALRQAKEAVAELEAYVALTRTRQAEQERGLVGLEEEGCG